MRFLRATDNPSSRQLNRVRRYVGLFVWDRFGAGCACPKAGFHCLVPI
jgi:hypothetical protein